MGLSTFLFSKTSFCRRQSRTIQELTAARARDKARLAELKQKRDALKEQVREHVANKEAISARFAQLRAGVAARLGSAHFAPAPDSKHPFGQVQIEPYLVQEPPAHLEQPGWAAGAISSLDARFLSNFIRVHKPRTMIEIGVASGYSTAIILDAMARTGAASTEPDAKWLYSYDISPVCYFDSTRKTGLAVDELTPHLADHLDLHLGCTALDSRSHLAGRKVDTAFIDGNHNHPWPLCDALAILPVVAPGAWLLLHDVFLPFVAPQFPGTGPNLLFSLWPGQKLLQPHHTSGPSLLGAIKLYDDDKVNRDILRAFLCLPWEDHGPDADALTALLAEL